MSRVNFGADGYRCVINGRRVRLIRSTENADGSMTIEGVDEEAEERIYAVDESLSAPTVEQICDANRRAEAGGHTPGPWEVVYEGEGHWHPLSIRAVGVVQRAILKYKSFPWHAGNNSAADARLMAAAPELLDEVRKSADTFAELAQTFRAFGYPTAAEACLVAERSNRAVLARAEAS